MSENQIEIIPADQREIELLEKSREVSLQKLFTKEGMDVIIAEIEKEVGGFSADVSTKEGRAAIVSMAAKIAKCKKPIKDLSMEAKEESRKFIDGVQEQWNRYEAKINEFHAKVRKPVDEIEEKEAAELKARQDRLSEIERYKNPSYVHSSVIFNESPVAKCQKSLEVVRELSVFDWGDFSFKAETLANEVIAFLETSLISAKKQEADAAELAQLKKEKAERDQKDREDQIAKDAAENARKAEEERIKKIEEDKRVAQEKLVIEERRTFLTSLGFSQQLFPTSNFVFTGKKSCATVSYSAFLEKDLDTWEMIKANAKKSVEIILQENEQFAKDEEKRIADEAVENERKRVEAKKKADDAAAERLAANKRHRNKIEKEVMDALTDLTCNEGAHLIGESEAKKIIYAIANGKIPHVQINY